MNPAPVDINEWISKTNRRLAMVERQVSRSREQGQIRLTDTTDASLSSTEHAFQIGADDQLNIIMDSNEIMARNNGAASLLNLNADGGTVTFATAVAPSSAARISIGDVAGGPNQGRIVAPHNAWGIAAGRVVMTSAAQATGATVTTTVTFPVGRFTQVPVISTGSAATRVTAGYASTTTASTQLVASNWSPATQSGGYEVSWQAVQMTPTSATG